MTNTSYAICFREGPGYLLVDRLGGGVSGEVHIVISPEGKIYARKIDHVQRLKTSDPQSREVRNYKASPRFPQLITYREYLTERGAGESPLVSTASVWEFCNGGSLGWLYNEMADFNADESTPKRVPDAFAWLTLYSMLDCLLYLFTSTRPVTHCDTHTDNWFLHWETSTSALPVVKLGDFGGSNAWPGTVAEATDDPWFPEALPSTVSSSRRGDLESWFYDIGMDMEIAMHTLARVIFLHVDLDIEPMRIFSTLTRLANEDKDYLGYPKAFVKHLARWYAISTQFDIVVNIGYGQSASNPYLSFLHALTALRDDTKIELDAAIASHSPGSPEHLDLRALAPKLPSNVPMLWQDLSGVKLHTTGGRDLEIPIPWSRIGLTLRFRSRECELVKVVKGDDGAYQIVETISWSSLKTR